MPSYAIIHVFQFLSCPQALDPKQPKPKQESTRHADALDAVTSHLGLGQYSAWTEDTKVQWLTNELHSKRPLIPKDLACSADVREVLDTFDMIAELGTSPFGAYVISMTRSASDVLAVRLLQKEGEF